MEIKLYSYFNSLECSCELQEWEFLVFPRDRSGLWYASAIGGSCDLGATSRTLFPASDELCDLRSALPYPRRQRRQTKLAPVPTCHKRAEAYPRRASRIGKHAGSESGQTAGTATEFGRNVLPGRQAHDPQASASNHPARSTLAAARRCAARSAASRHWSSTPVATGSGLYTCAGSPPLVFWLRGPDRIARCDRHPDKGRGASALAGPEYLVATGAFVLLSAVAARTPNPRFHMLFVLSAVAYQISFSIRHFSTLD
jgi:hypothetical protein